MLREVAQCPPTPSTLYKCPFAVGLGHFLANTGVYFSCLEPRYGHRTLLNGLYLANVMQAETLKAYVLRDLLPLTPEKPVTTWTGACWPTGG